MTTWKRATLTVAAIAVTAVAPALVSVGAGTAHADDPCYGMLQGSYYCSPGAGGGMNSASPDVYTPVQPPFGYNNLPQCSGGALAGVIGALNGDGC